MNKSESKYFNTAELMREALLELLEKKNFEFLTVKEICIKAGVNRSTFYLHYETTYDLLRECVEETHKKFVEKFKDFSMPDYDNPNQLVLINEKFVIPYLEFVKENKKIYKLIHEYPDLFTAVQTYNHMFYSVFYPILKRFGFNETDSSYMMEYYSNGVSVLIMKWVAEDCKEEINKIYDLILLCIRLEIHKYSF